MGMGHSPAVVSIGLGIARAFLVRCGRWALVDTGMAGSEGRIARAVADAGLVPERDIALIILTHGHSDHMGAAPALRGRWHVPIAMHRLDAANADRGSNAPLRPTGAAGWVVALAARLGAGRRAAPLQADVLVDDEVCLHCLGLEARILHTPGHTAGSVSLLTDEGDALIGDLVIGHALRRGRPRLPYVAEDPKQVRESVRGLLARRPRSVHSAHGRPFTVEDLARWCD